MMFSASNQITIALRQCHRRSCQTQRSDTCPATDPMSYRNSSPRMTPNNNDAQRIQLTMQQIPQTMRDDNAQTNQPNQRTTRSDDALRFSCRYSQILPMQPHSSAARRLCRANRRNRSRNIPETKVFSNKNESKKNLFPEHSRNDPDSSKQYIQSN